MVPIVLGHPVHGLENTTKLVVLLAVKFFTPVTDWKEAATRSQGQYLSPCVPALSSELMHTE